MHSFHTQTCVWSHGKMVFWYLKLAQYDGTLMENQSTDQAEAPTPFKY